MPTLSNIDTTQLALTAPVLSAVMSVLTGLFIYTSARFSMRNKQVDMILHDHVRFDQLQEQRLKLLVAQLPTADAKNPDTWSEQRLGVEADMFFDRFWSLAFDSYIAWYDGYVPSTIYTHWLFARWRELQTPSPEWTLAGRTLASTFENRVKRWSINPDARSKQTAQLAKFVSMMSRLKSQSQLDMDDLLSENGPPRLRRYLRKAFGAY